MTFSSEKIRAFSVGDRVNLVSSKTRGDVTHCVETSFPKDDAPSVALAILEAAGIEYVTMAEACNPAIYISPERLAVTRLQEWKRLHDKRAERDAEDAKVREWRKSDQEARGVNPEAFPWENLPPNERASWASRYRAARRFFEEA